MIKILNAAEKTKAIFYGTGEYENGLIRLMLYNNLDKHLILIEHFTDSTLQLNDGLFRSYFKNTGKESQGNYLQGKEDGLWQRWDSTGHITDSSIYNNGEKIMQANFYYTPHGNLSSLTIDNFKTQMIEQTFYNDSGNVISKTNSKYLEDEDKVFTKVEIEASFPGGPGTWSRYITKEIQNHVDEFTKADYGTCIVKFIVGIDGKVSEVEATSMKGTRLAKIAVYAIIHGPDWIPAQQNGRNVTAYRLQPVTLTDPSK